ncbi:hypothetical protein EJ06DRAFT_529134 [Trichodelitschia bisporula]|uniref:Maintenance of telomere capping protein 6 n=1 Tax=Trichodelitschia bisporula TaxID=703511 RepID=A0A6G1I1K2_9PEZI|nr:hypothetical protein EJ06DRAFT_529134 [Trichodelitschia bisporula]
MPQLYRPDPLAELTPPWSTAFLSQRDLALRVPINYVIQPAISLTAACFGDGSYEDVAAGRCLSNLLAAGFRKLFVDLYWDESRRVWSLCPVELSNATRAAGPSSAPSEPASSSVSVTSVQLSNRAAPTPVAVEARQVGSVTSSADGSSSAPGSPQNGTATAPPPPQGTDIVRIGPYQCTSSVDLPILASVLADYLKLTSNTLAAVLTYLTLNLHVASPFNSPLSPGLALNGTSLPTPSELVSEILSQNLSSYLYTPTQLGEDRANLNGSWLSAPADQRPYLTYLETTPDPRGNLFTTSGWPSEGYVEFRRSFRLFAGLGSIDPQLERYNLSGDSETLFPSNIFSFFPSACAPSSSDTSWALAVLPSPYTAAAATNLTTCAFSPFLNSSLSRPASANPSPYVALARGALWSWAPGEPHNSSTSASGTPDRQRCALLDANLSPPRWRVADCAEKHPVACRVGEAGFNWRIAATRTTYRGASAAGVCPSGAAFSVPRTAAENTVLGALVRREGSNGTGDAEAWVDLNALDVEGCWVVGVDGVCPYRSAAGEERQRAVVVPTVAAVIVFLIAALTVFVKCAANRRRERRGRRRRRAGDVWEYEGVPA